MSPTIQMAWGGLMSEPTLRRMFGGKVPKFEGESAAFMQRMMAGVPDLAAMKCPTCGASAGSYAGSTGAMTCQNGHITGGARSSSTASTRTTSTRSTTPARSVAKAGPPAPKKVPPLPFMTATINLNGTIGGAGWITAAGVHREIAQAKAGYGRCLLVTVNSSGGEVSEAFAVAAALDLYRKPGSGGGRVVVHVPRASYCASAATIVALAADYIVMDPSARAMIHAPTGGEDGSITGSRAVAEGRMISLYQERTHLGSCGGRSEVAGVLCAFGEQWMDAYRAQEWGFADEIGDSARALDMAHALARSWPCWPESANSVRRLALEARAGRL